MKRSGIQKLFNVNSPDTEWCRGNEGLCSFQTFTVLLLFIYLTIYKVLQLLLRHPLTS
jgi:hypothetical protein